MGRYWSQQEKFSLCRRRRIVRHTGETSNAAGKSINLSKNRLPRVHAEFPSAMMQKYGAWEFQNLNRKMASLGLKTLLFLALRVFSKLT
jgi:hypothetical protein